MYRPCKYHQWQPRSLLLLTVHWSLVTGHWALVTGHWALGTGYWALGTGRWTLGTAHCTVDWSGDPIYSQSSLLSLTVFLLGRSQSTISRETCCGECSSHVSITPAAGQSFSWSIDRRLVCQLNCCCTTTALYPSLHCRLYRPLHCRVYLPLHCRLYLPLHCTHHCTVDCTYH